MLLATLMMLASCGFLPCKNHVYDNECDPDCNNVWCGQVREVAHVFDNACDDSCNTKGCGFTRGAVHVFDNACDGTCNTEDCGYTRVTEHVFDNACDETCNTKGCGYISAASHVYDNVCDDVCNVPGCNNRRDAAHSYDNACDEVCNIDSCGHERSVTHIYSNDCDSECNTIGCYATRTVYHTFAHSLAKQCSTPDCFYEREIRMQSVLLLGQSNMSGRGDLSTVAPIEDDRIFMIRNDTWVKMQEPICTDSNRAGIGLAASFSKAFVETFDCELGLVSASKGGSSLTDWAVGGDLYNNAVRLAKLAQESSDICAILWHQGESDQSNKQYAEKIKIIFDAMLDELGLDKNQIIIVTGELFGKRSDAVHRGQLDLLAEHYPKYGVAESDGLTVFDTTTHFDSQSLRVFGYRYFNIFYNRLTGGIYEFDDDPNSYYIPPAKDETDYIASLDFNSLSTGAATSSSGNVSYVSKGGTINVVEVSANDKILSVKTGYNESNSKYGDTYIDVINAAPENSIVVIEAKFKTTGDQGSAVDIFKAIGSIDGTQTTYRTIRVNEDGKIYNLSSGSVDSAVYLGYDLDLLEWTPIKVVLDLNKNLKTVYVCGVKVVDNEPITSGTVSGYSLTKTRLVQFVQGNAASEILIDDYRCYFEGGYICKENFENLAAGATYTENKSVGDLSFYRLTALSYVTVENGTDGNYLKFTHGSDGQKSYVDLKQPINAGAKFVIEGKFRLGEESTIEADLLKVTPASGAFNLVYLNGNGEICNYVYSENGGKVGQAIATMSRTEWTHIRIACDLTNNTKDIYVNGNLVAKNLTVYGSSITDTAITKCRIVQLKGGIGDLFVDDVRYYYVA